VGYVSGAGVQVMVLLGCVSDGGVRVIYLVLGCGLCICCWGAGYVSAAGVQVMYLLLGCIWCWGVYLMVGCGLFICCWGVGYLSGARVWVIGERAARAQCLVLSIEIFDKPGVCMYMDVFLRKPMRVSQFY
jgi:hypothetical protein